MALSRTEIGALSQRMLHDYDARTPGSDFANGLRLSLCEARQVQNVVTQLRQQRGETVVGYKIGCVCAENQKRHGLSHPVWGRLWSTEQHGDNVQLARADYATVAIEGEFAVRLKRGIEPFDTSLETIAESVEQILPVIELHNLVFRGDAPHGHELIANNAIHAGVVSGLGSNKPASPVTTNLTIQFDGQTVDEWSRILWPDDLLQAVSWLVSELATHGLELQPGQTILTGALGPPLPVTDVNRVQVTSSHFVSFTAAFF